MQENIAILSEWGNNSLDFSKRGVETPATHLMITALIMPKSDRVDVIRVLEAVQNRRFNGSPVEPDLAGEDYTKLREILEDIDEVPLKSSPPSLTRGS